MRRQGDHFNSSWIPLSCKSTGANRQQVRRRSKGGEEEKERLSAEREGDVL